MPKWSRSAENGARAVPAATRARRLCVFFFSSRRRHTRLQGDWSSDVCSSDLVPGEIEEIRAAGISILTSTVDIANVRLQFQGGCVANITASRVSTDRVRKLRLFQPHQYISVDYGRQDTAVFSVGVDRQISFQQLPDRKS